MASPVVDDEYVRALRERAKNSSKRKALESAAPAAADVHKMPRLDLEEGEEIEEVGEIIEVFSSPEDSNAPLPQPVPGPDAALATKTVPELIVLDDDDDEREEGEISDDEGPPPPSPPSPVSQQPHPYFPRHLPPPAALPPPNGHSLDPYASLPPHVLAAAMQSALIGPERFPPMNPELQEAIEDGTIGRNSKRRARREKKKKEEEKEQKKKAEEEAAAAAAAVAAKENLYDPVALGTSTLKIDEQEYRATRLVLLELISWGVSPEYFVSPLGLSREAILLYFRDLRIRLPTNLPSGIARDRKGKGVDPAEKAAEVKTAVVPVEDHEEGEVLEDGEEVEGPAPVEQPVPSFFDPETKEVTPKPAESVPPASRTESEEQSNERGQPEASPSPIPPLPPSQPSQQPFPTDFAQQVYHQQQYFHPAAFQQQFFQYQSDPNTPYYNPGFFPAMGYPHPFASWAGQAPFSSMQPEMVDAPMLSYGEPSSVEEAPTTPSGLPPPPPSSPPPPSPPPPPPTLSISRPPSPPKRESPDLSNYTASSTRLVRKLPSKRPSAMDFDGVQPSSATGSPLSESAAYVPFSLPERPKSLVSYVQRRYIIDISDEEEEEDDDDDDESNPTAGPSTSSSTNPVIRVQTETVFLAPLKHTRPTTLSPVAPAVLAAPTPSPSDTLQTKEAEIERMMALIAAMEKKQKARSPSHPPALSKPVGASVASAAASSPNDAPPPPA